MTISNSHRVAKLAQSSVTLSFVLFPLFPHGLLARSPFGLRVFLLNKLFRSLTTLIKKECLKQLIFEDFKDPHDYRYANTLEKLYFKNVLRPHANEKRAVFKKLHFRLAWTVDLTIEIKLRFYPT